MKRVIKASQYDMGDDYLQAKHNQSINNNSFIINSPVTMFF